MSQAVTRYPFWEFVGMIVLNIALLFHGDTALWMFSLVVFYVSGVPWELRNWYNRQGFMNVPEEG